MKPTFCKDGCKTVFAGSRFTTGAKSRYAPVEGEALGMAWALQKTCHFTLGNEKLTMFVDHKPLLKILSDRELGEINNPLNFKEKMLLWRFRAVHAGGKDHYLADAMSRYPVETPRGRRLGGRGSPEGSTPVQATTLGPPTTLRSWKRPARPRCRERSPRGWGRQCATPTVNRQHAQRLPLLQWQGTTQQVTRWHVLRRA